MSDVKRKKVKVEAEVVELKIQLSAEFFDRMDEAKKMVADKRGYDVSYGKYMEEAMDDLVKMVEEYSAQIVQASEIIKQQDDMLGNPSREDVEGEKPIDPKTKKPEEAPESMYGHLAENYENDPMIG